MLIPIGIKKYTTQNYRFLNNLLKMQSYCLNYFIGTYL